MRSRIMRSNYSTIDSAPARQPLRLARTAGVGLALVLLTACGGGSSDSDCDPTVEDCEPIDGGADGGSHNDSGSDGSNVGGGDSSASEIPLNKLRAHLDNTPASLRPPKLDEWESKMTKYGHDNGQYIQSDDSTKSRRKATYYDGQRVYMQIAEYMGERQPWTGYAETAGNLYRGYVDSEDGNISGYWRFSHGSYMDYALNGDESAHGYMKVLRDEPSFSDPTRSIADGWDQEIRCREIAYALQSQMVAEKAGEPRQQEKVERFVELALGHVEIWLTGNYISHDTDNQWIQAFMAGLTASALIEYYERSVELGDPDERIRPAIRKLADWLWKEMWVANAEGTNYGAFEYRQYPDGSDTDPKGDLNMLIVPMYGWLYKETGDSRHLDRGDKVFEGGVELAWLGGGKQFNQNYRDSFDYLRWRQEGVERYGN